MTNKKLYLSSNDKMIFGVCGGLAEYLEVDSTVLRVIWVALTIFTGGVAGLLVYILAAMVMPKAPGMTASTPASAPEAPATPEATPAAETKSDSPSV